MAPTELAENFADAAFWRGDSGYERARRGNLLPRKHPGLKALPVKLPGIRQPVGITTLKNRSLSPVAQMFIESVRELDIGFDRG